MPNYQLGKIYKLTNGNYHYYGSTTQQLHRRLTLHKQLRYSSKVLYEGENEVVIELVENYPCDTKKELFEKERWYIENNECVNNNIPGRTKKEYRETYKERDKIKHKEWSLKNKDKQKENNKKWCLANPDRVKERRTAKMECECGSIINKYSKSVHIKSLKHKKYLEDL